MCKHTLDHVSGCVLGTKLGESTQRRIRHSTSRSPQSESVGKYVDIIGNTTWWIAYGAQEQQLTLKEYEKSTLEMQQ